MTQLLRRDWQAIGRRRHILRRRNLTFGAQFGFEALATDAPRTNRGCPLAVLFPARLADSHGKGIVPNYSAFRKRNRFGLQMYEAFDQLGGNPATARSSQVGASHPRAEVFARFARPCPVTAGDCDFRFRCFHLVMLLLGLLFRLQPHHPTHRCKKKADTIAYRAGQSSR